MCIRDRSVDTQERSWSYEELCNTTFKLILPAQRYQADGQGGYTDLGATDSGLQLLYDSDEAGISLKVVGVARPSEEATASMVTGAIGYTSALTEKAIAATPVSYTHLPRAGNYCFAIIL